MRRAETNLCLMHAETYPSRPPPHFTLSSTFDDARLRHVREGPIIFRVSAATIVIEQAVTDSVCESTTTTSNRSSSHRVGGLSAACRPSDRKKCNWCRHAGESKPLDPRATPYMPSVVKRTRREGESQCWKTLGHRASVTVDESAMEAPTDEVLQYESGRGGRGCGALQSRAKRSRSRSRQVRSGKRAVSEVKLRKSLMCRRGK